MKKLKNVFLICMVILPLCLHSYPLADSSFYPMALGNEWEYNSDIDPHSDIIGDTIRINAKLYYGFGRSIDAPEYWLREENNKVYCLHMPDSTEFLLYDFSIEIGDSIELPMGYGCSFGGKIFLIGKNDTVITPAGTFFNCYHFQHQPNCMDAGLMDTWFSKGVGKVKFVAVYIFGILEFPLINYSVITSVKEKYEYERINSFVLSQNYPNPFNPETNFNFTMPEKEHVVLEVYNMLGQKVVTLLNEVMNEGVHTFKFNGQDLNSGVYFYKIKAGKFEQVKKMILLK